MVFLPKGLLRKIHYKWNIKKIMYLKSLKWKRGLIFTHPKMERYTSNLEQKNPFVKKIKSRYACRVAQES